MSVLLLHSQALGKAHRAVSFWCKLKRLVGSFEDSQWQFNFESHFIPHLAPIGIPSNTSGIALNSTHIYIDWDPPPVDQHLGELREYRITVNELETLTSFQLSSAPAVTEATIGPLHPYYTYSCTILAVTIGEGPPSTVITVRTAEDGKMTHTHLHNNVRMCNPYNIRIQNLHMHNLYANIRTCNPYILC